MREDKKGVKMNNKQLVKINEIFDKSIKPVIESKKDVLIKFIQEKVVLG